MDAQDISSHSVQVSSTKSYTYQKKAGLKIKVKVCVGLGDG
jgi:hypothetical protein